MTPDVLMAKAERALSSAKLLLSHSDSDGACNRAYYAMYDAAQAAILKVDPTIKLPIAKTHNGLVASFGRHVIKKQFLSVELGKSLNRVERIRLIADYTGEQLTA